MGTFTFLLRHMVLHSTYTMTRPRTRHNLQHGKAAEL